MAPNGSARNRVLSACTTCQSRRVKCIKEPGDARCELCQRGNIDCVVLPDGRRRPVSRAEVDSLNSRIQMLESMLRSQAAAESEAAESSSGSQRRESDATQPEEGTLKTPPATHPVDYAEADEAHQLGSQTQGQSQPLSQRRHSYVGMSFGLGGDDSSSTSSPDSDSTLAGAMPEGPSKVLIDRLISPSNAALYDLSTGRLRHASPIIAFHQFSQLRLSTAKDSSRQQDRRIERTLRDLSPETHDHLMDSFWLYYHPVMQAVDREDFEEDWKAGGELAYSGFLHICILAMGYIFADQSRPDIQRIALPNKESSLHREAKYLVEFEFDNPGKIPSVQALLILGQLESGCGRDAAGWIYAGVAFRSALDIGLDLDCSKLNLTAREQRVRSYALRACTSFDRLWAIYLGRSRSLKSTNAGHDAFLNRSPQFHGHIRGAGEYPPTIEKQCFDALLGLLDLSARTIELLYSRQEPLQRGDYLIIAGLDTGMKAWYASLPEALTWAPGNIETAPLSYFHLHSQYHASLVLLHRPFASTAQPAQATDGTDEMLANSLSTVSKAICLEHALKTVHILCLQLERFDVARFPQAQLQHIGTAVAALISAVAVSREPGERARLLEPLHSLAKICLAIAPTYVPARMISDVLDRLLKEPGWGLKAVPDAEQDDVMHDFAYNPEGSEACFLADALGPSGGGPETMPNLHMSQDGTFTFQRNEALDMLTGFENNLRHYDHELLDIG